MISNTGLIRYRRARSYVTSYRPAVKNCVCRKISQFWLRRFAGKDASQPMTNVVSGLQLDICPSDDRSLLFCCQTSLGISPKCGSSPFRNTRALEKIRRRQACLRLTAGYNTKHTMDARIQWICVDGSACAVRLRHPRRISWFNTASL